MWFARWVAYVLHEGLFLERQHFTRNPIRYCIEAMRCMRLLSIDFSGALAGFPRERIAVIRGKNDTYFCDENAAAFLHAEGIQLIEVAGGHNWGEGIENALKSISLK